MYVTRNCKGTQKKRVKNSDAKANITLNDLLC